MTTIFETFPKVVAIKTSGDTKVCLAPELPEILSL